MDILGIVWENIVELVIILEIILILTMIFWERNGSRKMTTWIIVILLLPVVGFFLYLIFGQTFYSQYAFVKKGEQDKASIEMRELDEHELMASFNSGKRDVEALRLAYGLGNAGSRLYTGDNDVDLLPESQKYFDSLLEDLKNAEKFIHFEYYIMRNDEVSNQLMDILIDRCKNGVKVRLMLDAIGNNSGPKKKIKEFKAAGGEFTLFHSILTCTLSPRKNNRNHRKIAIIDGDVAYVGGYNIGDEYLGKGPFGYWRDCAVRIAGNAVTAVNLRFILDWRYATKKDLVKDPDMFVDCGYTGEDGVQIVSGGPDQIGNNPIQMQYFYLITAAKKKLYIHTPYLAPSESLMDALKSAAFSGVDVKIIIPDKPDHPFVYWSNRFYASVLMKAGIEVYEYNRGFVHSKTMVADGIYSSIGSANFDYRSTDLNFETNAMVYSEKIGKQMEDAFAEDLKYCTQYTLEKYESRTILQKFNTGISKLFSVQL